MRILSIAKTVVRRKLIHVTVLAFSCGYILATIISCSRSHSVSKMKAPFFKRSHSFDCVKIINGIKSEIQQASNKSLLTRNDFQAWEMVQNCSNLFENFYFPSYSSDDDDQFSIAYSILVHKNAEHFIKTLQAHYSPNNLYCIHVDWKSSKVFYDVINSVAKCIPNVLLSPKQESVFRDGFTMVQAFLNCFRELDQASNSWTYVITLQEFDFPLRTNTELIEILKLMDGANDVELLNPMEQRINFKYDITHNDEGLPVGSSITNKSKPALPFMMKPYKGSSASVLSRDTAKFIIKNNISIALRKYYNDTSFADESFWATIVHNEKVVGANWAYPGKCLQSGMRKTWITRYSEWQPDDPNVDFSLINVNRSKICSIKECNGIWRHTVCQFGVGDLQRLVTRKELFLNKFHPAVQPVAFECFREYHFNRTYLNKDDIANNFLNPYLNLSAIRYRKWLKSKRTSEFEC